MKAREMEYCSPYVLKILPTLTHESIPMRRVYKIFKTFKLVLAQVLYNLWSVTCCSHIPACISKDLTIFGGKQMDMLALCENIYKISQKTNVLLSERQYIQFIFSNSLVKNIPMNYISLAFTLYFACSYSSAYLKKQYQLSVQNMNKPTCMFL